jgi:O-antigen/teichoic acid export membrane protein
MWRSGVRTSAGLRADVVHQDQASPAAPHPPKVQAHDIAVAVRNSLKLGGSLLVTWSVALIVKLQVPAHLGPVRQGHFGFAESFAGMFFTIVGLGVDTYVIKEVSVRPKHASEFVGGVFALRILMSVALFAAMWATLWATGRPREIQLAVLVFGLTQLVLSLNATLSSILQATTYVGRLAIANIAAKIIWGAGLLLGLHYNVALYLLALPVLASEAMRTLVLIPASRALADLRYRVDVRVVRAVLIVSFPFFVNAMAIGFGNNLAMTALEFIRRDEREVGWFAATQNLATLAMLLSPLLSWVVMPLLSRARARSEEEMMALLRRAIEALIITIAPVTVFISSSSEIAIRLAFGERYAPAATGLSILSLVFSVTYLNMILSSSLIVLGKSWPVTLISLASIVTMAGFMLVFVPLGRALFHTGGECAGAGMAFIANEACVVVALQSRFPIPPLDSRNIAVLTKTVALSATVLVLDRLIHGFGPIRLVLDMTFYVAAALTLRIVRLGDVRYAIHLIRARRTVTAPESSAG